MNTNLNILKNYINLSGYLEHIFFDCCHLPSRLQYDINMLLSNNITSVDDMYVICSDFDINDEIDVEKYCNCLLAIMNICLSTRNELRFYFYPDGTKVRQ